MSKRNGKKLKVILILAIVLCTNIIENNIKSQAASVTYSWPVPVNAPNSSIGTGFYDYLNHNGCDFPVAAGTPVYAVADGTAKVVDRGCMGSHRRGGVPPCSKGDVCSAWANNGNNGSYGNYVYIDHGNGVVTRYCHLSTGIVIVDGQSVKQGQLLGYSGAAGNTTGPHLHFEIRINGNPKDPAEYLTKVNVEPNDDKCSCSESYSGQYVVSTNGVDLNMRGGHSTSSSIVTTIKNGTEVKVTKGDGTWAHVEWNGYTGYCSMTYLKRENAPQGYVDKLEGGVRKINIKGWAFDLDDVSRSLEIHVYIGGEAGSGAEIHKIQADKLRTDVEEVYSGVGNYHGFLETISTEKSGKQLVSIYAIDVGTRQNNVLLGSGEVIILDKKPVTDVSILNSSNDYCNNMIIDKINKTITLSAKVMPEDATNKNVTWSSSDETIATVDTEGKIVLHKNGIAYIKVETADGGFTSTCLLKVVDGGKIYGDCNEDGRVSATDLSTLNQAVNGNLLLSKEDKLVFDLNGDGKITTDDLTLLNKFVLKEIVTFPVEEQLAEILITKQPTKKEYYVGDTIDTQGMVVVAYYNNGTNKEIKNYKVNGTTSAEGGQKVTVTYEEGGISKSNYYNILVSPRIEIVTVTPTIKATATPTATPTIKVTATPTVTPTIKATATPTVTPTIKATATPTVTPTIKATAIPTVTPTIKPTATSTMSPTIKATATPTATPALNLTTTPTLMPTLDPIAILTVTPMLEQTESLTLTPIPTKTPPIEPTEAFESDEEDNLQYIQSIKKADIVLLETNFFYDGKAKEPKIMVVLDNIKLKLNEDYTITYKNNVNIGKGKIVIFGKGQYNGIIEKTFKIEVKKGTVLEKETYKYKVLNSNEVAFHGIGNNESSKVVIPKTVSIGGKKFKVTAISSNAFKKTKVTSVTIGDNVKKIGNSAFEGCSKLTKVTIGKEVTKIENNTFKGDKKLKTITIKSKKLKSVGSGSFKNISSKAKIKVPEGKAKTYKSLLKKGGMSGNIKVSSS